MDKPKYLKVSNWDDYQHYKDRDPVWIKLYRSILDDYEFECLQDASKLLQVFLWLLAAKLDNKIPYDLTYISKRIPMTKRLTDEMIQDLIKSGFMECYQDASKPIAECYEDASPEKRREETEKNREEKKYSLSKIPDNLNTESFISMWKEWVDYRIKKKKPMIDTTVSKQLKLLAKVPVANAISAIDNSIANGYTGVFPKADKTDQKQFGFVDGQTTEKPDILLELEKKADEELGI